MGLHRLEEAEWLITDEHRETELAEKARLLVEARDDVLAVLPGSEPSSAELLELVVTHLARTGIAPGPRAGTDADGRPHPIEVASRAVQEDLCVLERDAGAWRLVAGCVCFPSRWSLREKLGTTLAEIHGPVPGFDTTLAGPSSTFFDRLAVGRPVWRSNWTLVDTPVLHLPTPAARRPHAPPSDLGDALWFRVERQTLRRLARTDAIVLTIRTTVQPLSAALAAAPGSARALRATLATVTDDVARYKGWTTLLAPLDVWLAAHEQAAPAAEHLHK